MPQDSVKLQAIEAAVAKIAGTPSEFAWAQAYNAGKLYAVISLQRSAPAKETEGEEGEEEKEIGESLAAIGKETLERLQKEFFSLEVKDLTSIKGAVERATADISPLIKVSLAVGSITKNVLYVFTAGGGEVIIRRGEKFGVILENQEGQIKSGSGFVEPGDIIFFTTDKFKEIVPHETLASRGATEDILEISEAITPLVHEDAEKSGAAACLILSISSVPESEEEPVIEDETPEDPKDESTKESRSRKALFSTGFSFVAPVLGRLNPKNIKTNRQKKAILAAAVSLFLILVLSIMLSIRNSKNAKTRELFESVYTEASQKYDEGKSLKDLNEELALDNFHQAQKILNDNKDKFKEDSEEKERINALLSNISQEMTQPTEETPQKDLDKTKLSISIENGSGVRGAAATASAYLKDLGYNVTSTGNADKTDYEGVSVQVKKDKSNYLNLLKNDLAKKYKVGPATSDLPSSSSTDALVIIGK